MVKGTTSMGGFTKKKVHIRCMQVVVFQRLNAESIPGLNGIHRCKKLLLFLVH
jgi:hypothetical protein